MEDTTLLTVTAFASRYGANGWPTESALRRMIFDSETNGFDAVIRRVGRRVLIDVGQFFAWVERTNGGAPKLAESAKAAVGRRTRNSARDERQRGVA